ncbi:DUF6090 family protein [Maribacter sp. PR1]|uniref:DUF6090 family protein n=1 Tax=Maribacter cobaltidurans TaxID=1178778 RepID=A0ABU7IV05_9FLAO|nr:MULTISPECIES: DUF6090 family protein [Maribacter]MDC6389400.1 DUF6090 family protein [Maribacter sp. PR1]MEE1976789.1 DUF6090 family protein [Maribacter cobaltidurans]
MIKFFRRIRKQLLSENKFNKYLLYAIGEIILVVIGILIALQINNWNEERLENNREKITVQNLNTEFQENLRDLDSINTILHRTILATETIFGKFKEDNLQETDPIDSLLHHVIESPSWKPSEFVLNDLQNSGGLSKLNNPELKILLFNWSRFFKELQETMDQTEKTNINLIEYIREHGSLRNIDTKSKTFPYGPSQLKMNNSSLLQNIQFENYIDDKLYVLKESEVAYAQARTLIQKILKEATID